MPATASGNTKRFPNRQGRIVPLVVASPTIAAVRPSCESSSPKPNSHIPTASSTNSICPIRASGKCPNSHIGSGVRQLNTLRVGYPLRQFGRCRLVITLAGLHPPDFGRIQGKISRSAVRRVGISAPERRECHADQSRRQQQAGRQDRTRGRGVSRATQSVGGSREVVRFAA